MPEHLHSLLSFACNRSMSKVVALGNAFRHSITASFGRKDISIIDCMMTNAANNYLLR